MKTKNHPATGEAKQKTAWLKWARARVKTVQDKQKKYWIYAMIDWCERQLLEGSK